MQAFKIDKPDQVALNAKDMKTSIKWHEEVLELKKFLIEKWGEYPVFMLKGKTGVAIFPANLNDPVCSKNSNKVKIDHFAFTIKSNDFNKAIDHQTKLNLTFEIKDHHYFKSIYTHDPDGHIVELTTPVVQENEFYKQVITNPYDEFYHHAHLFLLT